MGKSETFTHHPDVLGGFVFKAILEANNHDYVPAISEVSHALATVNEETIIDSPFMNNFDSMYGYTKEGTLLAIAKHRAIIATGSKNEPSIPPPYYVGFAYIAVKIAYDNPEKQEMIDDLMQNSITETSHFLRLFASEPNPSIRQHEFENHLEPLFLASCHIAQAPGVSRETLLKAGNVMSGIERILESPRLIRNPEILTYK